MSHLKSGIAVIGIDIGKNSFHLVGAQYQEKLRVKHLAMKPSLQGTAISFRLENHSIKIRLPTFSPDTKWSEYVEAEADSWDKDGNILAVHIYAILVIIEDPTFSIPTTAAQLRHERHCLLSRKRRRWMSNPTHFTYLRDEHSIYLFE